MQDGAGRPCAVVVALASVSVGKSVCNPEIPPLGGQPKEACVMMRRLSKWAGVMLAMFLVLGLPFVAAAAGKFTVEFNPDGTISRVFSSDVTSAPGRTPVTPKQSLGALSSHLAGKSVNNITSVTIVTTADDPCIIDSNGRVWCW